MTGCLYQFLGAVAEWRKSE